MSSKTVYPGMEPVSGPGYQNTPYSAQTSPFSSQSAGQTRPLMGFLFSVSRTPYGEYWPLYVGPNKIGRGANCDIRLNEESVSENHATLVIHKMQNKGVESGVLVYIKDEGSTYGTMLNDVSIDFNPQECKSGDIITVGANYELLFILVDAKSLGLTVKENFKPADAGPIFHKDTVPPQQKGTMPGSSSSPFASGRKPTIYMPTKNDER